MAGTVVEGNAAEERFLNRRLGSMSNPYGETYEYSPEMEYSEAEHYETAGEADLFSEVELMELGEQLLEVTNEAELDQFLGDLLKGAVGKIAGAVGIPPGVINSVGGLLKGAAKAALPLAGTAVGGFFGGPLGAQIGRGAASAAGNILGLEAELNGENYEFEGAKNFVRMAADALQTAATAPPDIDPADIPGAAVTAAAERHAPGLLESARKYRRHHHGAASGRWFREGRNVIIVNCG
jgi:hypothetical protein